MLRTTLLTTLLLLSTPLLSTAQVTQNDFTGIGQILVLNSSDWRKVDPAKDKVGCLADNGGFINPKDTKECGIFTPLKVYPYTLSSRAGNCTFEDQSTERNTDSIYGTMDHAWSCKAGYVAEVYDGFYTLVRSTAFSS